jgi:RNA polymerase sigma-70 factor (ECF subfamily)
MAETTATDLTAAIREARARWPAIALGEEAFRARLAGRIPAFPVDAYLAAACAAGDAAAIRALEDGFLSSVPAMVRRLDASEAFAAEILQRLRVRLLVGDEARQPRVGLYTGEVPLGAWIRVIAIRIALNAKRPLAGEGAAMDLGIDAPRDPEIDYLRATYREPFARAFEQALTLLPKDDRTVLRLHYVDGVNIDGIGKVFGLHRATIARRLVRIRADLLAGAKVLLAERLGADVHEAESLMGALAEEIDVTLSRVLGGG